MMKKKKSNRWERAKLLLAVLVAVSYIMLYAIPSVIACFVENVNSKVKSSDKYGDLVFTVVQVEPEFPGGTQELMKFIADNLRYPKACVDEKVEGRVILSFVVEKDGSISDVQEMRSPDARLTEEAIRVISTMPKWKPGKMHGEVVRVKYMLPVTFKLDADNTITDVKGGDQYSEDKNRVIVIGLKK